MNYFKRGNMFICVSCTWVSRDGAESIGMCAHILYIMCVFTHVCTNLNGFDCHNAHLITHSQC